MPVWEPKDPWEYREDGFFRTRARNGKPIVVYGAPYVFPTDAPSPHGQVSYAVRPVVRVKMGRREVQPMFKDRVGCCDGCDYCDPFGQKRGGFPYVSPGAAKARQAESLRRFERFSRLENYADGWRSF